MEEHLTILKIMCGEHVIIMNKNLEINEASQKNALHQYFLIIDYNYVCGMGFTDKIDFKL